MNSSRRGLNRRGVGVALFLLSVSLTFCSGLVKDRGPGRAGYYVFLGRGTTGQFGPKRPLSVSPIRPSIILKSKRRDDVHRNDRAQAAYPSRTSICRAEANTARDLDAAHHRLRQGRRLEVIWRSRHGPLQQLSRTTGYCVVKKQQPGQRLVLIGRGPGYPWASGRDHAGIKISTACCPSAGTRPECFCPKASISGKREGYRTADARDRQRFSSDSGSPADHQTRRGTGPLSVKLMFSTTGWTTTSI
jgi:hypothetical protein